MRGSCDCRLQAGMEPASAGADSDIYPPGLPSLQPPTAPLVSASSSPDPSAYDPSSPSPSSFLRSHIPRAVFDTRSELFTFAQGYARTHGFSVSVGRSHERYVYLNCSRGGHYTNRGELTPAMRRRQSRSRKTGCLFQARGWRRADDRWELSTLIDAHNHPAEAAEGNPRHRRMTAAQREEVERLTAGGVRPAAIIEAIRSMDPTFAGNSRTIYNARAGLRRSRGAGAVAAADASTSSDDPAKRSAHGGGDALLEELAAQSINRRSVAAGEDDAAERKDADDAGDKRSDAIAAAAASIPSLPKV